MLVAERGVTGKPSPDGIEIILIKFYSSIFQHTRGTFQMMRGVQETKLGPLSIPRWSPRRDRPRLARGLERPEPCTDLPVLHPEKRGRPRHPLQLSHAPVVSKYESSFLVLCGSPPKRRRYLLPSLVDEENAFKRGRSDSRFGN